MKTFRYLLQIRSQYAVFCLTPKVTSSHKLHPPTSRRKFKSNLSLRKDEILQIHIVFLNGDCNHQSGKVPFTLPIHHTCICTRGREEYGRLVGGIPISVMQQPSSPSTSSCVDVNRNSYKMTPRKTIIQGQGHIPFPNMLRMIRICVYVCMYVCEGKCMYLKATVM